MHGSPAAPRPRAIELGDYFGHVEDGQLVAMAGERTAAPGLRDISGVCTRPGYQGRGLARRLMLKLVRRQLARGETPFLQVMSANARAHRLYLEMGFRDERETVVRVVTPVRALSAACHFAVITRTCLFVLMHETVPPRHGGPAPLQQPAGQRRQPPGEPSA
jgi:hypothetical protein